MNLGAINSNLNIGKVGANFDMVYNTGEQPCAQKITTKANENTIRISNNDQNNNVKNLLGRLDNLD